MGFLVYKVIGSVTDSFISEEREYWYMDDKVSQQILKALEKSDGPMETNEIIKSVESTRTIVLNRLKDLRGEGKLKGKRIEAGAKGVWIWWK